MIRYAKQPDKYGCGPVGIANALKWAGVPVSFKQERQIFYTDCKSLPDHGTWEKDFQRALRKHASAHITIRSRILPGISEIEMHLESDGAVLLLTGRTEKIRNPGFSPEWKNPEDNIFWGHYVLVTERHGNGFKLANEIRWSDNKFVGSYNCPRWRFRQLMRHYPTEGYPHGWFLARR